MKNLLLILVFFSSSIFLKTQSVQMYFCDHDTFSDVSYYMRVNFHEETLIFGKTGKNSVTYAKDKFFKWNPNKPNSIEVRAEQYSTSKLKYLAFDVEKMKGSAKLLRSSKINNFTCRKGTLRE